MIYAFETDTVWGFGANINDKAGIDGIYEIKNRDRSKPLILMSNKVENLLPYVKKIPYSARALMKDYFPGALTLVLEKSDIFPKFLNPEFSTVGIRVPNHAGFQDFCAKNSNLVLATTSANVSSEPPCANADEVAARFGNKVKVVGIESGNSGKSSTVVAFDGEIVKILRQGDVELKNS